VTQHDSLVLVTANRTEIAVQQLLRIDDDFVTVRGRIAGSQDAGRVFFVPFIKIDNVRFQREVKEAEFHDMFADFDAPAAPEPPPPVQETPVPPVAPSISTKTPVPIKSAVLERFRNRSTPGSNQGVTMRPPVEG
jgi:hypothetical protein